MLESAGRSIRRTTIRKLVFSDYSGSVGAFKTSLRCLFAENQGTLMNAQTCEPYLLINATVRVTARRRRDPLRGPARTA
jgi:hypothetical protein